MKNFILFLIMGVAYFFIEILWRGYSHFSMVIVGGLCGLLIGLLNEKPSFYNRKVWQQCAIGTAIVLVLEFTSGLIVNKLLGWNVWDYSHVWGNVMGQICLPFGIAWFFGCVPMAIALDDWLRYKLFGEPKQEGLLNIYIRLFLLL